MTQTLRARSFIEALHSPAPAPDRAEKLALYGFLVGSWTMDAVIHGTDGSQRSLQGSISAGWVLEGRALQDVFEVPGLFYGTTLRVYDPAIDAWHIAYSDPLNQAYVTQIGRAAGRDIVQLGEETPSLARLYGTAEMGPAMLRWSFRDIAADSFRWRSERSTDGEHWHLQREYLAKRAAG